MKQTFTSTRNFTRHHPLITGTILLTSAGFLSRIIGFFYRIYLSRLFGEEGMGIYQLIHPLSALAFSLTAAAFQTAISKFVAAQACKTASEYEQKSYKPMLIGLSISVPLSLAVMGILYFFAEPLATYYLQESRTLPLIRLLAFTVPFSAAHACINGYFYGIQKADVPAWTQLLEQFFRVGFVILLSTFFNHSDHTPSLTMAVLGLIIGEIAGFAGALIILIRKRNKEKGLGITHSASSITYRTLLAMVIPLSANRVFLNALMSIEAATLPVCLKKYGYDTATALSIYGVLTGMAFPLIFFPNALTGSVSVMLLPIISENIALGRKSEIRKAVIQTIQYCSILGFFCMAFFLFLGRFIGNLVFKSELAGYFISELSFLCPFLYMNSTLSGILQGLGKATSLFLSNMFALLLRLAIIFLTVPIFGIKGYLWGLLASQIIQTASYLFILFFRKNLQTVSESSKLSK